MSECRYKLTKFPVGGVGAEDQNIAIDNAKLVCG